MRIAGEWRVCDDGVTRPAVQAKVQAGEGTFHADFFLVDSCADRTVLSAAMLAKLGPSATSAPAGFALQGIGGVSGCVPIQSVLEFTRDDGGVAHVRGEFAAFTDPAATDLSILGRDVLNIFDVILSRRRNEVLLLAPNHQYRVERV
jgi:hypothetical protein